MYRHLKLYLYLFLFLVLQVSSIYSLNVKAYTVTQESDTLLGEIHLSGFNQTTGAIYITGFDLEALHYEVWFRANGTKRFKLLTPKELKVFSFRKGNDTYEFRSFTRNKKSIKPSERDSKRFLMLVHSSKVKLYRDVIREPYRDPVGERATPYYTFIEYYLFNSELGLLKVESGDDKLSILDLLKIYGIEDEFITQLPKKSNFKDISTILWQYIEWRKQVRV